MESKEITCTAHLSWESRPTGFFTIIELRSNEGFGSRFFENGPFPNKAVAIAKGKEAVPLIKLAMEKAGNRVVRILEVVE